MNPTHNLHRNKIEIMKFVRGNCTIMSAILEREMRYILCKLCVG